MKNINLSHIAFALLPVFILGSCAKEFLNVKPKGRDVVYLFEHYEGLLFTPGTNNFIFTRETPEGISFTTDAHWTYMTDELMSDQSIMGNMMPAERNAFRWAADMFEADLYPLEFGGLYNQIYVFNVVVNGVMDAEDATYEQKRRVLSEARVARAYNYMMLAQFFGKPYNSATAATDLCVPLVLEASTGTTSFTRATVQQIYDFVLTELEESVPYLAEHTQHRQRIYRFAGYAILGRAYMFMHDYEKATAAFAQAETLLSKSSVELALFDYKVQMPVWKDNFLWDFGLGYPSNFDLDNVEIAFNRRVVVSHGGDMFSDPKALIKPEYMDLFAEGDLRKEFYTDDWGYYSSYRKGYRSDHNEGVDLPAFYLFYAECLARTNQTTQARELITYLRQHRFEEGLGEIPENINSKEDLIKFVVEERLREYMGTGHRWFDMRRLWNDPLFQDLKANYIHTDELNTFTLTEDRLVYRIPPSVMRFNSNWTDNP